MNSKYLDIFIKLMSALVIPLIIWGATLETTNAVQDTKIVQLEKEVAEAKGIKEGVTANTNALGRMEEKLNAANDNLKEIKSLVRSLSDPHH